MRTKDKIPHWAILLVIGIALASNLLSNACQNLLTTTWSWTNSFWGSLASTAVFFALLYGLTILLWRNREKFLPVRILVDGGRPEPKECLVIFLSGQSKGGFDPATDGPVSLASSTPGDPAVELTFDLAQDVASMEENNPFWNWAVIVRALLPHAATLRRIHFLCSPESLKDHPAASALVRRYLPSVDVPEPGQPLQFEHVGQVLRAVERVLAAEAAEGREAARISIDVTGGQKITSIAGASMTLRSPGLVFQYVGTNKPFEVKEYDLIPASPDT